MKGVVKGLIAGGIIIGIGIAVLLIGLSLNGWKLKGNMKFEMQTYTAQNDCSALNVNIGTGSVKTEYYDGDKVIIEYPTAKNFNAEITEADGTITLRGLKRKWYTTLWFSFDTPDTVLKLPKGIAYNLQLDVDAGSVNLGDGVYGDISANTDAGQVKFGEVTCNSFKCRIDAGNIECKSLTSAYTEIRIDAGNTEISLLDSSDIKIRIDAGNITAKFTGVNADYNITSKVSFGHNNAPTNNNTAAPKKADLKVDAGQIDLSFAG